jgi:hypothetical protein
VFDRSCRRWFTVRPRGADDELDALAHVMGIQRVVFPSTHPTKSALTRCLARGGSIIVAREPLSPLKRNPLIVDAGQRLIACPKNDQMTVRSGTWSTVRYASKQGRVIEIIYPNGRIVVW